MATEAPQVNLWDPLIQELRDAFERSAFPDGGLEDCEDDVARLYNEEFKRPYVCVLIADVLSGRWKLGTTQEEVSERLGIKDRSWVSRALHQGQLSLDIYLRLRDCPTRPENWEPDIERLRPDMERSAFIGVARHLATLIPDRPTLAPQRLSELDYELVCEIIARLATWLPEYVRRNVTAAQDLVRDVCLDPRRNVCPEWCTARHKDRVAAEIERLCKDRSAAYEHLGQLQRDWIDIFVGTHFVLELVKWSR